MLRLREAGREDRERLNEVHLAAAGSDLAGSDLYWDELLMRGGVLIAEIGGLAIGFGSIDTRATEQIKHLYILPEHQGTGIGARLLKALEEIGRRAGLDRLRLHSAPGAVRFYERHGYREAGSGEAIGHDHEGVEMIKHFGEEAI